MPSVEEMRATVAKYVEMVGSGDTEGIVALYRADATVEDPAGTPPRTGSAEIREFYKILEPLETQTTLVTSRIAGNTAAFLFTLVTKAGENEMELSPIDVMEFDDEGKIVSMKAYWSQADLTLRA